MCLANIFEEGDRRQQDTTEQEMMEDIEKADRELVKRVACSITDVKDAKYLAARLNVRIDL